MKAALVLFDHVTFLDFVGFYDPITRLKSMNILDEFDWDICSTMRSVTDDKGLRIEANVIAKPLDSYDVLFVPGGFGTRVLQHDRTFIDWLKTARAVPLKVSVCTGALLIGAAGLLQGRRATTHPSAYKALEPHCAAVVHERIVDEGDIVTAGGVSSSIDLGLHLVQRWAGTEARDRVAAQMDYPYRCAHRASPIPSPARGSFTG